MFAYLKGLTERTTVMSFKVCYKAEIDTIIVCFLNLNLPPS